MSRNTVNFLLDSVLLTVFVALLWTSALLAFVFPQASRAADWILWGLDYDDWHHLQLICLAVMAFAVLLHLILHWAWVCGFIASRLSQLLGRKIATNEATRTIYGVATLVIILSVLIATLVLGQIMLHHPN